MRILTLYKAIPLLFFTFLLHSCEEKGTITKMNEDEGSARPSIKNRTAPSDYNENDLHTVVVNEVLPTQKYIYLNVDEGDKNYWIATLKQEVIVGKRYIYKGGLLKTNFESKEYKRMFEEIYLVKNLVPDHGNVLDSEVHSTTPKQNKKSDQKSDDKPVQKMEVVREGSLRIADLVKDPSKYEGKTVQISGICVKINPNIMKRNWIHLRDGSQDDYDLVITSDIFIPEGTEVTMVGSVSLNKDFGAGYKYDLIVENGTLLK